MLSSEPSRPRATAPDSGPAAAATPQRRSDEPLAGDQTPVKTVGSFWPYATTLFDYVRRAMPLNESKSLTNDEVYAVVAYLLQLNGIISEGETINAYTLPKVSMPNSDGFGTFSRGD